MGLTAAYKGRRVLVTGHTGFKGGWLSLWLHELGADVTGYALAPPTEPSIYDQADVGAIVQSVEADVRDGAALRRAFERFEPELVFHLAAQSLVRESYRSPIETFDVNVLGTARVLEAVRSAPSVRAVVVVTSDKCYENREWHWAYRENEPLGGVDPYSSSKACAELVASAYRNSFFSGDLSAAIVTVRAGNVIGGGDWAQDRLVPDIVRASLGDKLVTIRNPGALRPWQHVLDPLAGYLMLGERLTSGRREFIGAWNFGPAENDVAPVSRIVEHAINSWDARLQWERDVKANPHEAGLLKLDSSKARTSLGWRPRLGLASALDWTFEWYSRYREGENMRLVTQEQLRRYIALS